MEQTTSAPASSNANSVQLQKPLRAIVVGGSGAVGRKLIAELVQSPHISQIVSFGRREVPLDDPELSKSEKLQQKVINMDELDKHKQEFEGNDVAFCCLGTTTGEKGTAHFKKIDHDLVMQFANISKEAHVPHFSLVSSVGASSGSLFTYMQVKGQVEDECKQLGFSRLTIWQPGMLDRGSEARWKEKVFGLVMPKISTGTVARAMLVDAVQKAGNSSVAVDTFGNSFIFKLAKAKL